MKKTILTLILILIAVYIVLSILGSRGEYAAEKLFYRAMKANEKIVVNPDVAPPKLLTSVENDLHKLLEKYPNSNTAKSARMALADFYVMRKKYDKALSTVDDIIKTAEKDASVLSKARFFKGNIYEKQDKWEKALKEYTILRDEYADTPLGVQMPLYIGKYYTAKSKEAEANKAYGEAVLFYEKLEKENKGKMIGYVALTLLRETYMAMGDYEKAGGVIENTINEYPAPLTFAQQLPYAELIFVNTLKRPEKAIEIYKSVIEKTKDKQLIEILQKKISQLEAKESK
jgi:tetratricopeptide (TPR) repeat protein